MKYKKGDKIICSVSNTSIYEHDVFTVRIITLQDNEYGASFEFHVKGAAEQPILFTEKQLEQFASNYRIATSPLAKALS